ncbi:MAG: transglycosylase SLT domain-containing protein [Candidatus Kapabacteria bacterium]|nr:transglycosylase SLT domain-containing protein [Candidatus Kapabacteria bacterium]
MDFLPLSAPNTDESAILLNRLDNIKGGLNIGNKKNISAEDKIGIEKAARGFEAIFVNMMLKEMRNTKMDNKEESDGFGMDTLQGYTDLALSDQISKTGKGMGIAEVFYTQLTGDRLGTITSELPQQTQLQNIGKISEIKSKDFGKNVENFSQVVQKRINNFDNFITNAAQKFGVPEYMIKAVITAESAGRVDAKSSAGAKGLMQLMDGTAQDMGINDPYNPQQNIEAGTRYLKEMLNSFDGDNDLALAAYNAGPGNVQKYGGVPPFKETQSYIQRVKKYMTMYQQNQK